MNEDDKKSGDGASAAKGPRISDSVKAPLPKRFYREAKASAEAPFGVHLDGRPLKTPGKRAFALPSQELAETVADEWANVGETIDPARLPITCIINSAIDGVADNADAVADEIAAFAANDMIIYRAETPEDLVLKQTETWDPLVGWAREALGVKLTTGTGVMPVVQPDTVVAAFAKALPSDQPLKLAALHVLTTLTGSAVIGLAHARGFIDADAAWAAAHIDEDFQISQWGEDGEAAVRRKLRRQEFDAASTIYRLS